LLASSLLFCLLAFQDSIESDLLRDSWGLGFN
jgi:hypothetical protein